MTFSGYIPLRRGLIEHTYDGRLSNNEALVFVWLLMMADKETGRGMINARVLRTFLPELSKDSAKRVLRSLEEKRYILREITPRSPLVYPYWIDGFIPSTGTHKLHQLDLSKALDSRDVNDIRYLKSAPVGALETAPVGAPVGAHYYNKRKEDKREKIKLPSLGSKGASTLNSATVSELEEHLVPCDGAMVPNSGDMVPDGSLALALAETPPPMKRGAGLVLTEVGFKNSTALRGNTVSYVEVNQRIAPLDLEWKNGHQLFRLSTGTEVPWNEGLRLIEGKGAA